MTLSDALKAYKDESGRSFQSIADELGISASFVRAMIVGDRLPRKRETVQRLATMLNVSPDYVDHMCHRVAPDIIEHLAQNVGIVERIRREMV